MKIGLIDVDGHNYPNLPLMKLSAWHKAKGDVVRWYEPFDGLIEKYDKVYASKVFSFSPDYQYPIYADVVEKGGSGYCIEVINGKEVYKKENDRALPYEVEHIYPDYSIYPEQTGWGKPLSQQTCFGFLTRGCPRGCAFCHVESKEGRCSRKVADLCEFWKGQKKIVLCDPNILACKDHIDLLEQLVESGSFVDFNQGIDIRLVNERNLALLKRIKIERIHIAFDDYRQKDVIEEKMRLLRRNVSWDRRKLSCYILTNFDTTIEQDLYRIMLCRQLDIQPFPMIYNKGSANPIYKKLQRWCSPFIFWKVPKFEDFVY